MAYFLLTVLLLFFTLQCYGKVHVPPQKAAIKMRSVVSDTVAPPSRVKG